MNSSSTSSSSLNSSFATSPTKRLKIEKGNNVGPDDVGSDDDDVLRLGKMTPEGEDLGDTTVREKDANEDLANCPPTWRQNIDKVLFTSKDIERKVGEMAARISEYYADVKEDELVVVGLLSGAVQFHTELVKRLKVPYKIDWMALSSYGASTTSRGSVSMKKDMSEDPKGKHILIAEDLIDTGTTLAWLKNFLSTKNAASVKIACLLNKTARRKETNQHVIVDFIGFHCPDEFVIGFGMDFAGHYRGLPFVGVLKPEAYAPKKDI